MSQNGCCVGCLCCLTNMDLESVNEFRHPNEAKIDCCQNGCNIICWKMIFCPLNGNVFPKYNEIDCCYCKHEYKHGIMIPNNVEVTGIYCCVCNVTNNYISSWYIAVKILLLLVYITGLVASFISFCTRNRDIGCVGLIYWPMSISSQMNVLGLIYYTHNAYLTLKYYKYSNEELLTNNQLFVDIRSFLCSKILLQISLVGLTLVTLQYYLLVNPTFTFTSLFNAITSIHIHGITLIIILIDFAISYKQVYYKSCIWFFYYGTAYFGWLILYDIINIGAIHGLGPIYSVVNFRENIPLALIVFSFVQIIGIIIGLIFAFCKNIILVNVSNFEETHHYDRTNATDTTSTEVNL